MKSKLDLIEARLKKLFESSLQLFPGADLHHQLALQFTKALKENLALSTDGESIAPDQFILYLHPDMYNYWHSDPQLLEFLSNALLDAAVKSSIKFNSKPTILLSANPDIPPGQLQVFASPGSLTQTQAVVSANLQPTVPDSRPLNAFLILNDSRIFPLNIHVVNIGRRADNQLVIDDARVSRIHAQLRARQGKFILVDLNSSGGTFVNGQRISQVALHPGDVISLAGMAMIYGEDAPPSNITVEFPPISETKPTNPIT